MGVTSWLGTLFEFIGGIFNIIWAVLCLPVYAIIRTNFNIFIKIAELNILSSADMNEIYKRVTMIITIVMSFYVIFNIIKYTISPDTITDKEKGAGNIAKRIIVAILLIAFVPTAFSMAYKIQNRIISTQVIPKVILGQQIWDYSTYGSSFAADTFSAFYRVDREHCGSHCEEAQEHVSDLIESIRQDGSVIHILGTMGGQLGLSVSGHTVPAEAVEFDGLFALIFGCYVIYVIFIYSIDVAVRYIQLLYLQIISPVAIMGYIVPRKDNIFQRWLRQCSTTYLDLFIRISIMYFAMLIIQILGHSLRITNLTTGSQASNVGPIAYRIAETDGSHIGPIVYIFFIMGVLIFVQRAPKLLEQLFPSSSSAAGIGFGFQWKTRGEPLKKSIDSIRKPIATTAGAVASTITTVKSLLRRDGKDGKLRQALKEKDYPSFTNSKFAKRFGNKLPFLKEDKFYRKLDAALAIGKSAIEGGKDGAKANSILGAITNKDKQEVEATKIILDGGSLIGHDFGGMYYKNMKEDFKRFLDGLDSATNARKTVKDSGAELKGNKAAQSFIANWNELGLGDPTARAEFGKTIERLVNVYARSKQGEDDIRVVTDGIAAAFTATGIYDMDDKAKERFKLKLKSEGIEEQVRQRLISQGLSLDAVNERIASELEAVLQSRIKAEEARLEMEKEKAVASLKAQFMKDVGSNEILIQANNLEEAQKIVLSTKDMQGQPLHIMVKEKTKDSAGRDIITETDFTAMAESADTDEKKAKVKEYFARHLGDIEKFISEQSIKTKYSSEYKEANANANVPGKKNEEK